ncbi:MAG: imidazole glycerol phosphate synthase subunit HisF [Armatimonadetes bacterium]|nr:imidazole glycerol phosphate synthase subunit HisF [Armatimonadota bacterium]
MRSIRLIACLDVKDGRVVKGTRFENLQDSGDPVELARYYADEGIDELVFLDITASHEGRPSVIELAERVSDQVFIPFTVGGGLASPDDIRLALLAGADKVSLNTAAIRHPQLLTDCAVRFGSQCVVCAVDARRLPDAAGWEVLTHGGRRQTGLDAVAWAREAAERGAGEILLTSMDRDGVRTGYDLDLTRAVSDAVPVPVIASGGAGVAEHLAEAVQKGHADAVLVSGILHERLATVHSLKRAMQAAGLPVRLG